MALKRRDLLVVLPRTSAFCSAKSPSMFSTALRGIPSSSRRLGVPHVSRVIGLFEVPTLVRARARARGRERGMTRACDINRGGGRSALT